MPRITDLRRYALARSLFAPTTLRKAVERLGFVQADPILAPARAQDLILRHRVRGYRVSDLERHYPKLPLEEDYFLNYGFLPRPHQALLHPRRPRSRKGSVAHRRMDELLAFAQRNGEVHPREAAEHFAHGRVQNYWGGESHATTQLLDQMHFQGLLRVARRDNGIRVYAARPAAVQDAVQPATRNALQDTDPAAAALQARALLDLAVKLYAPLPDASLTQLTAMLRRCAPQLGRALTRAAGEARASLAQDTVDGARWYWPAGESLELGDDAAAPVVRLLAPFDPVVWDRRRFEHFWGWAYRFEAYTPAARRKLGYYALPLLWRDRVIGWGNLQVDGGVLAAQLGYVAAAPPREGAYRRELEAELLRLAQFLRLRHYHCGGRAACARR
jgi:uncharacterized protein YcaQ